MSRYSIKKLIRYYRSGLSTSEIADKIGCTQSGVFYLLKRHGFVMRTLSESHRKYKCNSTVFDRIDSGSKAYWLGFLYADGCVKNNSLILKLHNRDLDQLYKFKAFFDAENPIKKDKKNCSVIVITNKHVISALLNLGITEKKSLTIKTPKLKKCYMNHFYRGFFDGDGWITSELQKNIDGKVSSTRRLILYVGFSCGSIDFITDLRALLFSVCNREGSLHRVKNKRHFQLTFGGNISVGKILKYLYKDATIFLSRKHIKIISIAKYFNKDKRDRFIGKNYANVEKGVSCSQ